MKRQKGQAMTETAIALAFVILPLILLIPFLHKISEVRNRTSQAAQYAAWERTVWRADRPEQFPSGSFHFASKSEMSIHNELPWRFFSKNGEALRSNYSDDWSWENKVNPLLKHNLERDKAPITIIKSVGDSAKDKEPQDRLIASIIGKKAPGLWESGVGTARNMLSYTGFSLDRNRFYEAKVSATMEKFKLFPLSDSTQEDPMQILDLNLVGSSALLANSWNAGGPVHAKNLTERLVLTKYMDMKPVSLLQQVLGIIPFGRELKPGSLRFGHTDMEAIPANRLCNYGSPNCGNGGK
ncbi:hypothetical protein MJ923_02050 [Shewanella sp. 3B26]|uniref:Uncharacterized protein n=1 Tax=Shewanella zhuhaiensis TaxID=2919576 RepID=A0AAJ1BFL8_9GAMM|nr:hypothetical protein [Shewanella zhuhaiensis]MCH4293087.1 hypothetical protein [Shewanella zhuhaiensis]